MNRRKSAAAHKKAMQKQKTGVDARIAQATEERGVAILLSGDGKGKTSAAFGMVMRTLGYGHKIGIVQFIKGARDSGEALYLAANCPQVELYRMGTGFTWDTQDRDKDVAAAEQAWAVAARMLADDDCRLVVLDELTYMLSYAYLDEGMILAALAKRPHDQSVVVTGRGGGTALREFVDTVSEVKNIKHAFKAGIKACEGVDF